MGSHMVSHIPDIKDTCSFFGFGECASLWVAPGWGPLRLEGIVAELGGSGTIVWARLGGRMEAELEGVLGLGS